MSSEQRTTKERIPLRPAPEPLEANDVATITVGVIVWFVLFLVQLPFYGWYSDHGHTWFIWTCLAGGACGLLGLLYVRARRDAIRRHVAARAAQDGGNADGAGNAAGDTGNPGSAGE
ncbi:DUF2530 domain-containing protein [Streptomyces sp. NBC_01476]|uniref:DUF2530 domain-containing protein n=1 Tax=Streptomyces sp. NBC_01476 TaxID=2903881 RepID=UPI002E363942|nr:DUF2530 domain-containing protein [Streptomyces sp. NBC_01476]